MPNLRNSHTRKNYSQKSSSVVARKFNKFKEHKFKFKKKKGRTMSLSPIKHIDLDDIIQGSVSDGSTEKQGDLF